MQEKPKVSILVPVYKVEAYISRCARAILEQDYDNIEAIFVDDCSPDGSIKKLQETIAAYPGAAAKVKIIRHERNQGQGTARKTALLAATGEYILHSDSDDWLEPHAVSRMVALAVRTDADMVVADYYHTYSDFKKRICCPLPPRDEYLRAILFRVPLYPWSLWHRIVRREVHLKALPVEGLNFGEDYVIVARLVALCRRIEKLNEPVYNYWQENTASTINNFSEKSFTDTVWGTDILCDFFSQEGHRMPQPELNEMRFRNKLLLLQLGAPQFGRRALALWPEAGRAAYPLSAKDRVVWLLASLHAFGWIARLLRWGSAGKRIFSKLKNKNAHA